MRSRIKKTVAALAAAVTISSAVSVPSGCSAQDDDGTVKLRWVTYSTAVPADIKEVIAAANAYSKEKIGVTVELEVQPSEMINLIMASGEYYDMIFTCEWLNPYDTNAAKGLYYDITDLVQSETPVLYDTIGDYWEAAELHGRLYGVPVLKDMGTEMMYRLNSDYFEGEKGMEIPEFMDFADIEPYLAAYKADYPHKYPLAMDKSGIPGMTNFMERIIGTVIFVPYEDEHPRVMPLW
ncbi:MAG: carbohydrate ABC transporter substrate-binding protein, partial [Ruminiclostridium sp.]|nr:carbohydrate ABC transporter substrate-binding protein [Ruminiclostridium sp.]